MRKNRQGTPAVPDTVALAPDVSAPAKVDDATAAVTTEVAQALATGEIDLNPAPVIDTPTDGVAGVDAVAIATADARADEVREPIVPVPATQALPADQITPVLPASEVAFSGAGGLPADGAHAAALASLEVRVAALEARQGDRDCIVLRFDRDGNLIGIEADLPEDEMKDLHRDLVGARLPVDAFGNFSSDRTADLRRDVLGVRDVASPPAGALDPNRRGFPVLHEVLQDGSKVRPNSRDRVRLTHAEHVEAVAGGIVTLAWDDGDPVWNDGAPEEEG